MSFYDPIYRHLCDAELQSEDGCIFHVHRIILAMKSKYFKSLFCGMDQDRKHFQIPGVTGSCLQAILKHLYEGGPFDAEQNLTDLMIASDYLRVEDLQLEIKLHLMENVTISNCLPVLDAACHINDEDLTGKYFRFVETKFETAMVTHKNDVAELSLNALEKILGSRNLNVSGESTVWHAIVEWVCKDILMRSQCVPRLLTLLALKELDENLAVEIMEHEIVSKNEFMKDLKELKASPGDFASNLDVLLHFLENRLSSVKQPLCYRIPGRLHVAIREEGTLGLFISYDEKLDLWRKIGVSEKLFPITFAVVGRNAYLFGGCELMHEDSGRMGRGYRFSCKRLNIVTQQWQSMSTFEVDRRYMRSMSGFEVDGCVYLLVEWRYDYSCGIVVYDTVNDKWYQDESATIENSSGDPACMKSVKLNKKIYAVRDWRYADEMTAWVFDTESKRWEPLPSPQVFRRRFSLLSHCGKVYIIGGWDADNPLPNAEVFDPQTNSWEEQELPPPFPGNEFNVSAFDFNDRIIAYNDLTNSPRANFCWNATDRKWDKIGSRLPIDFRIHRFLTVDDEEAIRAATKGNRDPAISLEKGPFS